MSTDLVDLVQRLGEPHILVIGDLMLDRYVWGNAERISQEAPVILLHADCREERLGGASSVATMLGALGARVSVAGVVGADPDGCRVRQVLDDLGIDHQAVLALADRPTTVKERYVGRAQHRHPQQMIRVDYEVRTPLAANVEADLIRLIRRQLATAHLVLVSDYDKGVCTPGLLGATIAAARERGLRTVADPIRGKDYGKYRGCSSMTPNRLEAGLATGRVIRDNSEALAAAAQLQQELDLEAGLVTLDKDGIALAHRDGRRQIFPARPRQVYDITGAGDMVMAVLGMALAAGADYEPALRLANVAGGLEVEKIGVATVSRDEIIADLIRSVTSTSSKVLEAGPLGQELRRRRSAGQRVAFTSGCFDVLHAEHVQYLQEARAQGDVLVVGLQGDASVRALEGSGRPVNPADARALVLAALQVVDYVVLVEEPSSLALLQAIRPDVLVQGADDRGDDGAGASFVESYGGRVHLSTRRKDDSTPRLSRRLAAA